MRLSRYEVREVLDGVEKDQEEANVSRLLIDSDVVLVSDTSFVINLNATGFSDRIVRAMPLFVVTEDVLRELGW